MSIAGLELANLLNTDFPWKGVSKRRRSASRRGRKLVGNKSNLGVEIAEKSTAHDTTVSESEKLGVAILGRRFSEKFEHVPIKKRRFVFRSPSPPAKSSSPHFELSKPLMATVANDSDRVGGKNNSEVTSENHGYNKDFSCIEMLATIAWKNSTRDETDHADDARENAVVEVSMHGRIESSTSAMGLEVIAASFEAEDVSSHEDTMEGFSLQDNAENVPCDKDVRTMKISPVCLQNDRLHWDLNVSMDAWEKPQDVDLRTNVVEVISDDTKQNEKLQVLNDCDTWRETIDIKHDIEGAVQSAVDGVVPSGLHGDFNKPKELRTYRSIEEGYELQACTGLDRIHDKSVATTAYHALESSTYDVTITESPTQVVSTDVIIDPSPVSDDVKRAGVPKKDGDTSIDNINTKQESDVALPYSLFSERTTCEIERSIIKGNRADSGSSRLHDYTNTPTEMMSVDTCLSLEPVFIEVKPEIKAQELDAHHPHFNCEDMPTSGLVVAEGLFVVTKDAKCQAGNSFVHQYVGVNSSEHIGSEEAMHNSYSYPISNLEIGGSTTHEVHKTYDDSPSSSSHKVAVEDPSNVGHNPEISQSGKDHIVCKEKTEKLQAGFESQYEDGELRESDLHCLEENGGNYGELKFVDYVSENMYTCNADALDCHMSENFQVGNKCMEERSSWLEAEICEKVKVQRGLSPGSDIKEPFVSSKTNYGSHHSLGGCKIREELSVVVTDGRTMSKDPDDCRDGLNYKSCPPGVPRVDNRVYRSSMKWRSPSDREDAYGIHRGMALVIDGCSDRNYRRYPMGLSRGSRKEYYRRLVLDDSSEYSSRVPCQVARGEHVISPPNQGRPLHYPRPYKKYRSRNCSPTAWLLEKEQNDSSRHHSSRSPNNRYEAEMERERLPLHKWSFAPDYEVGFISPPRRHILPTRNSRWFDDPFSAADHFKGRRLSSRTPWQSQRFDPLHPSRKLDSDAYFKPITRHGRFDQIGGTARGCRYEDNDDNRRKAWW